MKYLFKLFAILILLLFPFVVLSDYLLTGHFTGYKVSLLNSIKEVWGTWKREIWNYKYD